MSEAEVKIATDIFHVSDLSFNHPTLPLYVSSICRPRKMKKKVLNKMTSVSVDGIWRGRGEGFCGVVVSDYSAQRCLIEVVIGDAQQRASVWRFLHPWEKHCPKQLPGLPFTLWVGWTSAWLQHF